MRLPRRPRRPRPTRRSHEVMSDRTYAEVRLRRLGASDEEVTAFLGSWDDFDDQWTPESRAAWLRSADADLLAELAAVRLEYHLGTHTEEESELLERAQRVARLTSTAAQVVTGPVRTVLDWVGIDPERAEAALAVEDSDAGARRTTLIKALRAVGEA